MDPTTDIDIDPFDTVLSLEDQYYAEGHALGVADGSRAGRIEGRVFGLEKGFEKFVAMGALHGKAAVWAARLPPSSSSTTRHPEPQESLDQDPEKAVPAASNALPLLSSGSNPRLAKHITTLHALSEPASLSTQNDEDGVADFDDRFKRAQAKAKIVEKLVGEGQDVSELSSADVDAAAATVTASAAEGSARRATSSSNAGAVAKGPKRIGVKMVQKKEGRGEERSMEDFGGPMKGLRS
ncbi:hypothetical protein DIS24_g5502 [Lasiodiplodia hormozganensis]|uniref:Essential protein Yae1 N-terminal domain-containing protein n=1 Tax=Lasiodiplodia hormozganensis TaxID=869390 RepID=A0AA40CYT2_9PEZI|nr:hypothetical protein DIS24_g5502 [Lasiodiplodia hormozganensis]